MKEEKIVDGLYKIQCDNCRKWFSQLFYDNGLLLCRKCHSIHQIKKFKKKNIDHISDIIKNTENETINSIKNIIKEFLDQFKENINESSNEAINNIENKLSDFISTLDD